jgi:hypothetical protein
MLFTKIVNNVFMPDCLQLLPTFSGMCSCCSIAVAWVFAIVLDVEISQVHEIIEKCKNHDPPAGGGAPRRSAGASRLVFERRHLPPSRADNPPIGFWGAGRIISAQKPAEGNCIYRPVTCWAFWCLI